MIVHLEIYIVGPQRELLNVWRRTIYDLPALPVGMRFLLHSKTAGAWEKSQKWVFPENGTAKGEHYDTRLDAYIVWAEFNDSLDFTPYGFTPLSPERWP